MPFVIVHNALAFQRQSKPWVFLPAILRRMLTSLEDNNSRSPVERRATASNSRDDVVMDAGDLALRVVGQECLTIPLLTQKAPS